MPRTKAKLIIDPTAVGTLAIHLVRGDGVDVDAYLEHDGETAITWPHAISKPTTFHLRDNLYGHGYTVSARFGDMEVATASGELLRIAGADGAMSIAPRLDPARCLQALMQPGA